MEPESILVLLIPLAPLLGGVVAAFGGKLVPPERCHRPVLLGCGLSCAAAAGLFLLWYRSGEPLGRLNLRTVELFRWVRIRGIDLTLTVRIERLALAVIAVMSFVITVVGANAARAVSPVGGRRRLFAAFAVLHVATVMLLAARNLLQVFLFWQWLTLAAWLFARDSDGANEDSAGRVLLTMLAGDALLLCGIALCDTQVGTRSFSRLLGATAFWLGHVDSQERAIVGLIAFLIGAGVLVRCGQFPTWGWLTDLGRSWGDPPESVSPSAGARSALVQSVILPTGVYLVIRMAPLIAEAPQARWMLLVLGSLTAVLASIVALVERDVHAGLLFTAASQVGLMLAGAASGEPGGEVGALVLWLVLLTGRTALVLSAASGPGVRPFGTAALVIVASGVGGQNAILAALWSPLLAEPGTSPLLPAALATLSIPLTACSLTRIWLRTAAGDESGRPADAAAPASPSPQGTILLLLVASVAVLTVWLALPASLRTLLPTGIPATSPVGIPDLLTTGGTLLLGLIGLISGWLLSGRRTAASLHAPATGEPVPLVRLAQRRFYVDELLFLSFVFPLRAAAALARSLEWLIAEGLASGAPRRVWGSAGWVSIAPERGSGQFAALALVLATAVLLLVLVAG